MTSAHLHLALNHFPIVGVLISIVLLIVALGRRDSAFLRAGLLALLITALFALPVYFSGEPTEEVVENLAGVSHDAIEEHEEIAKLAFFGLEFLGVLAAFGLYTYRNRTAPRWYGLVVGLGAVVVTTLTLWTGALGGRIRHTEVRPGFSAEAAETGSADRAEHSESEEDDDG